mgnify:CR=1 FL=1
MYVKEIVLRRYDMEKKRFKFVIPVMVIVAIGSVYMLTNYYAEVPDLNQLLITICATLISGVLAYFLFPQQGENKVDDRGPY